MQNTAPSLEQTIFADAFWIWPESHHWDLYNCYAQFRKEFELKSLPEAAPLYITADQSYQLYLNGKYVCRGPARGFQKSWPYDEVDLRPYLKLGNNLIAVRAYNPGRSNFQYLHQGYAGLLLAAHWEGLTLVSDTSWKCRRQSGVNRNTVLTSVQLFPQEDIDLRMEDPNWMQPAFDDSTGWKPFELAAAIWNGMPWYSLEPRGIPMLDESYVTPTSLVGTAEGRNAPDYKAQRNIAINRHKEGLRHQPASGQASSLEVPPSGSNEWRSFLIDFGHVVVGSVELTITGAQGGEVLETFHSEIIDPETCEPHFLPEAHCRMAFAHRMTCRVGAQTHAFYHAFGFRYMVLTVRGNSAPLQVTSQLRNSIYPHEQKGSFQSSDTDLNAIWETCAWTQRICSMDAYVDTPWREQAQWWGDARVQAWNTFHFSGDPRLLQRGIRQIAAQKAPSGITYGHAPTIAHGCILPDFTLIWMATLWDEYWQTGMLTSFREQQDTIQSALSYFETWTDESSGLLTYDIRYWLFLDWCSIQKQGQASLYSLWLLYVLDKLAILYRLNEQTSEAERCEDWSQKLRTALLKLMTPSGLMADGILPDGQHNPECSVHSQTLALMNGLSPNNESTMLHKSLLVSLDEHSTQTVKPSAYWITYVYTELAQRGYGREVVAHIKKHWQPMVEHGSTFETFNVELGNISTSHAWSAHPLFHLMQIIGGIRQSAAGWNAIEFTPSFIGEHVDVSIPTPHGLISSRWKRSGDTISGELVLPIEISVHSPNVLLQPGSRENSWRYSVNVRTV